jgi:hypothetical protein
VSLPSDTTGLRPQPFGSACPRLLHRDVVRQRGHDVSCHPPALESPVSAARPRFDQPDRLNRREIRIATKTASPRTRSAELAAQLDAAVHRRILHFLNEAVRPEDLEREKPPPPAPEPHGHENGGDGAHARETHRRAILEPRGRDRTLEGPNDP